ERCGSPPTPRPPARRAWHARRQDRADEALIAAGPGLEHAAHELDVLLRRPPPSGYSRRWRDLVRRAAAGRFVLALGASAVLTFGGGCGGWRTPPREIRRRPATGPLDRRIGSG